MTASLDVVGLPVLDGSGRVIGSVSALLFDDRGRRVTGLLLVRARRRRARFLPFAHIRKIRPHELIAASALPVPQPPGGSSVRSCLVVAQSGEYLGTVCDVYFDERTGEVKALDVAEGDGDRVAPRRRLIAADTRPAITDVRIVRNPFVS